MSRSAAATNPRIVGRLETGEVFGEMCLIEPGPRSATVTAACDTECLAASYQDFIAAIEENPERAVGFMKTLVRRLRKMNELLESGEPGRPRVSRHASRMPAVRRLPRGDRPALDDAVVTSDAMIETRSALPLSVSPYIWEEGALFARRPAFCPIFSP